MTYGEINTRVKCNTETEEILGRINLLTRNILNQPKQRRSSLDFTVNNGFTEKLKHVIYHRYIRLEVPIMTLHLRPVRVFMMQI